MKKFLSLMLMIISLVSGSQASEPSIMVDSYDEAVILSKETELPILLIFTSDNCPSCISLKGDMPETENIIICFVDMKRKNRSIVREFNVKSIPDSVLIDKNGKIIKRLVGFKDKKTYEEWLIK